MRPCCRFPLTQWHGRLPGYILQLILWVTILHAEVRHHLQSFCSRPCWPFISYKFDSDTLIDIHTKSIIKIRRRGLSLIIRPYESTLMRKRTVCIQHNHSARKGCATFTVDQSISSISKSAVAGASPLNMQSPSARDIY